MTEESLVGEGCSFNDRIGLIKINEIFVIRIRPYPALNKWRLVLDDGNNSVGLPKIFDDMNEFVLLSKMLKQT